MSTQPRDRARRPVVTIDFHVCCECSQECPYCWGPQEIPAVSERTARRIIDRIQSFGIERVVFTGGDPLQRVDAGRLIRHAKRCGLEVALSTTGDRLTEEFLARYGPDLDLISLPLDGSCEAVSALTKEPGHFGAVTGALQLLARFPSIDVKVCTPVTQRNIDDVPAIAALVGRWADTVDNRVFYNVFQAFPRTMKPVDWDELLVSDAQFRRLAARLRSLRSRVTINVLSTETLDRLYVMIFPDGSLVVPSGATYRSYGKFLQVEDLGAVLARSEFDARKHLRHSRGWQKATLGAGRASGLQV